MELNKEKIIKDSIYSLARRLPTSDLTDFLEDLTSLIDKKDVRDKCTQIGFPLKI